MTKPALVSAPAGVKRRGFVTSIVDLIFGRTPATTRINAPAKSATAASPASSPVPTRVLVKKMTVKIRPASAPQVRTAPWKQSPSPRNAPEKKTIHLRHKKRHVHKKPANVGQVAKSLNKPATASSAVRPLALPTTTPTLSPSGWRKWISYLPFFSEKLAATEERTENLERRLQEQSKLAQQMARQLQDAEERMNARDQAEERRAKKLEQLAAAVPLNAAASAAVAPGTSAAPAQTEASAPGEPGRAIGSLKAIPKEAPPVQAQPMDLKDMAGIRSTKPQEPAPMDAKERESMLESLARGMGDMRADLKEAAAGDPVFHDIASSHTGSNKGFFGFFASLFHRKTPEKGGMLPSKDQSKQKMEPKAPEPKATAASLKEVKRKMLSGADIPLVKAAIKRKGRNSSFAEFLGWIKFIGMGKERIGIVQNMATMMNAGLPLIDSLKTLQMETKNKGAKKLLQRILESVENGNALWRAMEEQHFFTPHAIALIRIGEEAGNLAENMEYLAAQQEKDNNLRAKVKMAMIYPTIVLSLMFIIVMGLGMFVLPNLIQVLFSLNVKLPLVTRMVIAFTNGFTTYGHIVLPSIFVGLFVFIIAAKFTRFKVVVQWVLFRIPGIGKLARQATIARFGVILGGLLQAGVPLVEALKSLVEVTPIVAYRRFYFRMLEHVSIGDSFAKTFAIVRGSEKLIPISMQQLIITGEKTGTLAKIMLKVADIYEKEANDTAQKLPVILEPMLLLFIGALVGTIAFAIIVPIYSIVGNVSNQ